MTTVQLEFQIEDESAIEIKLKHMQKENGELKESLRKIQKKLFAEMNEIKKLCLLEIKEKEQLKTLLKELLNEKCEWVYAKGNSLFHEK